MAENEPWGTDRPLDAARVATLLTTQFPARGFERVRFLAAGWDNETFLVDETWALRFPKRAQVVPWLEKEAALLPHVERALDVEVPRYELRGAPSDLFPYPFVGYRLVQGVPADQLTLTQRDQEALADQLGELLGQLHAIDPKTTQDVPWTAPGDDSPERWQRSAAERAPMLEAALGPDLWPLWSPYALATVDPPAPYDGPDRVIHHDVGLDHVLLDPETRDIVGMIDFMDAQRSDPMYDFMDLYRACGPQLVARALRAYPHTLDEGFMERLRFMTRTGALLWLSDGLRREDEEDAKRSLELLVTNLTPELRDER